MGKKVLQKGSARLKFLYRVGKYLSKHTKRLLASALIQCYFDYSCSMWYSSLTQKTKKKLQVLQNKIIRYILNLDNRTHIGFSEFKEIGWLPVDLRVAQIKLNHFHRIINNAAPSYLKEQVTFLNTIHSHSTRYSIRGVHIPRVNTNGQNSFLYTACKLWNNIPLHFKNMQEISHFKRGVKGWFFGQMERDENSVFMYY